MSLHNMYPERSGKIPQFRRVGKTVEILKNDHLTQKRCYNFIMCETSDATIYQLRVLLLGITPMIWRRLLLCSTTTITDFLLIDHLLTPPARGIRLPFVSFT